MLNSKDLQYSLDLINAQICKEGLCNRPQLLTAVWEATKKVISNYWHQGRQTMLSNSFIARGHRQFGKFSFYLQPTLSLLSECSLKYRSQSSTFIQAPSIINEINIFKNLNSPEKQYFKSDKQLVLRFFYLIISKIKEILKTNRNVEILLDHFGIIRVNEKVYTFEAFTFTDKGPMSTPNLHQYKRNHSTKNNNSGDKNQQSKLSSKLFDTIIESKRGFHIKKRPYFHEVIVQNQPPSVKICSDLLGAGIDPLTYDYTYSKMIDHSPDLLSKQFVKPEHAVGRLPCVIDKFSRTKGSQLTGIKVGNSIIVRIGSNYSPTVRNYYLDISTKSIQTVKSEVKIKLQKKRQEIIPATERQQYYYITNEHCKRFESRVQLRKEMYSRYCQYYNNIIPNDCVAPLKQESIQRMVKRVKPLVKKLGRKEGSPLINSLMSQVNRQYYKAYKKSVLDYILMDQEQKARIGISIKFKDPVQWGQPIHHKNLRQYPVVNLELAKKVLLLNHILYPECLNKIYLQNEKITTLQIFKKRKQGEYRPYNILYYIKRNINQLNQAYNFLCNSWVKQVSSLIQSSINLKQQNYQKLKQFFNSLHIVMSNNLKQLLYITLSHLLEQFSKFQRPKQSQSKNLLIINVTEEGQKICFIDDIEKVFRFQLVDIIDKIIETTRRVPRVQNCLKLSAEMFIWGIDQHDTLLLQTKKRIKNIIENNYSQILDLKKKLSELQNIFRLKEEIIIWCKQSFKIDELKSQLLQIDYFQQQIFKVNCYYKVNMVVIDCIQLKKKLILQIKSLRRILFQSVEQKIKQRNNLILVKINMFIQQVSKGVTTTSQFVELSKDIQHIKNKEMNVIKGQIDNNYRDVMSLFKLEGFGANYDLMRSTYVCRQSYEELYFQVYKNQKRISEERGELQKRLREKISIFQTQTMTWLKQINSKIQTFDMRKLYSDYLTVLVDYQLKVQNNRQVQKNLNEQQQDLKWAGTTFTSAIELENIVQPNHELWQLVAQYDSYIRQWKYIQLSHFDIENGQARMNLIDSRITKLITKLKNFTGLKIVYELQNDVKEFLMQQVSIIKIFSNPGLKDRHWSLFNKRLPLPGYDLKELTYGRIKLLYQYQKNLKVLMSISNQAAKQFEIQNQKQEMYEYWVKLNFSLYNMNDQNIIFIKQQFLDQQIQVIEHHLTKTVILKNSPFSKALVQMLTEWENWLVNGRKILVGFRTSQQKFIIVRNIFKMDEISKLLPIQSTQYDSIQNIWKSVIKKIFEQPKVTEFFKSQKMPEIIEQIGKKADFIRKSFNSYLNLKRLQFNRLYFLTQKTVLHLIQLLATDKLQQAFQFILWNCFIGINKIVRDESAIYTLSSTYDSLQIICQSFHSKKAKAKFFQELVVVQRNMRQKIKNQIKQIDLVSKTIVQLADVYVVTSIFVGLEIDLSVSLLKESLKSIQNRYKTMQNELIEKIKDQSLLSLKYQAILSKIHFLSIKCQQNKQKQGLNLDEMVHFAYNNGQLELKIYSQNIKSSYQYFGDEVPSFIPTSTDKLLWQIAFSISKNVGVVCQKSHSLREIALFAGRYYVQIDNPNHTIDNNLQSCIMGIISTNYWINFVDQYLKMASGMVSLITQTFQLKKVRMEKGLKCLTFKNNQLTMNSGTGLFLSISNDRAKAMPQGALTCTRSIFITEPSITKFKQYFSEGEKLDKLKQYLQVLKFESNIKPGVILKQIQQLWSWQDKRQLARRKIWKFLSLEQRDQFTKLFDQNQVSKQSQIVGWKEFAIIKQEEIITGLNVSEMVFIIGSHYKSNLIEEMLRSLQVDYLFGENRGVNLNFIEKGVSQFTYLKYLEKARERVIKDNQIIIYIDCDINQQQLSAISLFQHLHRLSPQHQKPLKIIVQTGCLDCLQPASIINATIVSISNQSLQNQSGFKWFVDNLTLNSDDKISVYQLETSFENIISIVLKMQKRPFNDSKMTLTNRFFQYFTIYLNHLNSKQVQNMCEFDRPSYIFSSYIYCIYWSIGVSSLKKNQSQILKKHIKEMHGQKLQLPGQLNQIYLNQENEWVYWQNIKEEFISEKENVPIYQIWVPTANNTKLLTTVIKLIQNQYSVLLCGSQSGRSSLFSQISSFELSYNTFLIDCHRNTSIQHFSTLTKGRILYGNYKKNLILVDDLHLPNLQIYDILRTFVQRGYCPNSTVSGKLNENIYKVSLLASWNRSHPQSQRCFPRFYKNVIPIQLQKLDESQLQSIFRTYMNISFNSNDVGSNHLKIENTIMNFYTHTMKVFPSLNLSSIRILIESICRLDINKEQQKILQHLLVQTQSILSLKLPTNQISHFFRHMNHYYNKLLSVQLKNYNELKSITDNHVYDVLPNKQGDKKQSLQDLRVWMQEVINDKNGEFYVAHFHVKFLGKMLWTIKNNNSHVILLSMAKNGSHTLAKIASWLLGLGIFQLKNMEIADLLEEVVKVLKTGGKIDECMGILPFEAINAKPQLVKLVHSLIFSSQFHECFGQILMEQIIKSFNSQKKFLKKNVKKSELIKKIRQKFNGIFHFCVCVSRPILQNLLEIYPKFDSLRIIQLQQWPLQAWTQISIKFIGKRSQFAMQIIFKIEQALRNNEQTLGKLEYVSILSILTIYEKMTTFMEHRAKFNEQNTELWIKKIKSNKQKLQNLQNEKRLFESQHQNYFAKQSQISNSLKQLTTEYQKQKKKFLQIQISLQNIKGQCSVLKEQFTKMENQIHCEYQDYILPLKVKLSIEAQNLKQSLEMQQIVKVYKFTIEELEKHIMDLLNQFQKDYFRRLKDIECHSCGLISKIISLFSDKMEEVWIKKNALSYKFKQYQDIQSKHYEQEYKVKELQEKINQFNEKSAELKENQQTTLKGYEELKQKIIQVQSLTSILLKFQHVLKSKNELAIPIPKSFIGCAILSSYFLTYSPFLTEEQSPLLINLISTCLQKLQIPTTHKQLVSFMPQEQQFKINYCFQSKTSEIINIFGLQSSDLSCIILGDVRNTYNWMKTITSYRNYHWLKQNEEIKQQLQRDHIILIQNPSSTLVEQISNYLSKTFYVKNNARILIVEEQEIPINENCKIIFIFQNIQEIPKQLLMHNLVCIKMLENRQEKILKIMQQKLAQQQVISNRQQLVNNYILGSRQIGMMDDKLHSIIMKMKKQNVVSDIIYKKIEEQGQAKLTNEHKLETYKNQINNIIKQMAQFDDLVTELIILYHRYQSKLSFEEYKYVIRLVINKTPHENLNKILNKIENYLKICFIQDPIGKINEKELAQFEQIFKYILQKGLIIISTPDLSLCERYIMSLMAQLNLTIYDIYPEQISATTLKEGEQYNCLISRNQQWKQLIHYSETVNTEKITTTKLIILLLDHLQIPSQISINIPKVKLENILSIMIGCNQRKFIDFNKIQSNRIRKTVYQQQIEYMAYLNQLTISNVTNQMKILLDIQ